MDGGDGDEYATLSCRWSADGTVSTATLHLKVVFFDRPADVRRTVLRASAFVVSEAAAAGPDASGPVESVYEGSVRWEDAVAVATGRGKSDDAESVRLWLRNARAALTGDRVDGAADDSDGYEYRLQRGRDGERPCLVLTWKMKLGPFGTMTLGSVTLAAAAAAAPAECARRASAEFVRPLIDRLSAERTLRERAVGEAADSARRLLEDNERLLDRLRLLAETKKRDDRQLMERFLRVLNAKKLRLTAVEQQLSELKRQRRDEATLAAVETSSAEPAKVAAAARGRGKRRGGGGGTRSIERQPSGTAVKNERQPENGGYGGKRSRSIVSFEEDERMEDDVDVPHGVTRGPETMEGVVSSPYPAVSVPVDVDVFAADTQIDDVTADGSPPWFQQQQQQQRPVSPPTSVQQLLQPLPTDEDNQTSKHMTALDKLWSGIL